MTPEDIKRQVAVIAKVVDDDEQAHALEDSLWGAVLIAIRDGKCADPAACASEALKTEALDFSRWCA